MMSTIGGDSLYLRRLLTGSGRACWEHDLPRPFGAAWPGAYRWKTRPADRRPSSVPSAPLRGFPPAIAACPLFHPCSQDRSSPYLPRIYGPPALLALVESTGGSAWGAATPSTHAPTDPTPRHAPLSRCRREPRPGC